MTFIFRGTTSLRCSVTRWGGSNEETSMSGGNDLAIRISR